MKKITPILLLTLLSVCILARPSYSAQQTKILKPTSAELGVMRAYMGNPPNLIASGSGGGTDLNNALAEDGQFALLDPSLPGPTQADAFTSLLMLDYEKNSICPQAVIQEVKVHSIWKDSGGATQPSSAAVLLLTDDYEGSPSISVLLNDDMSGSTFIGQMFGGVVYSGSLSGGTFSGLVGTDIKHESSITQTVPTLANLNDLSARVAVNMGQKDSPVVSGYLDYAYLEVTYDDANCLPEGLDPSTIAPPKTGAALTAVIIAAGLLALTGASLFGVKRTKLKHRVSERE